MTDVHSPAARSRNMAAIRSKDTAPEILLRRALFALGLRYRLHDPRLPGHPDLVFPKYRAAIFIHGCFWHGHNCRFFRWPATRSAFWRKKITHNRQRDKVVHDAMSAAGWRSLIIWECAIRGRGQRALKRTSEAAARWLMHRSSRIVMIRGPK